MSKAIRFKSWEEFLGTDLEYESEQFNISLEPGNASNSIADPGDNREVEYLLEGIEEDHHLKVTGRDVKLEEPDSPLERRELDRLSAKDGGEEYLLLEFMSENNQYPQDYHESMDIVSDLLNADIRTYSDNDQSYYGFGFRKTS